ncbi:two-partner secretion domain-containing protein, partial [Herbaspirillum rubrisubalbicans]
MNKIYRLVFSKRLGMMVAVAETTNSRGKGSGGVIGSVEGNERRPVVLRRLSMAMMAAFSLNTMLPSWAASPLPTGAAVTHGVGSVSTSGQTMTIQQSSQMLGLNWNSFNIGAGNTVNFVQPGSQAVAVNRVIGNEATQIYGNLNANGRVYLINPNGIVFGATSQVNVGALLASTATNVTIANGSIALSGQSGASIVNQGNIKAADGGFVVLTGQQVTNTGTIEAKGGYVALTAGDKVSLQLDNGALLSVNVDAAAIQALVDNKGLILADGGKVYLTASGKNTLLSTVVNNEGVIRAQGYGTTSGGTVVLLGQGGDTLSNGAINVSGQGAGQKGGTVVLGGDRVAVYGNASIDASGVASGGAVVIGGDSLHKATSAANIGFANQTVIGSGAQIYIGSGQGDGGFVETSGKQLSMQGQVHGKSAGKAGQWLIDPTDITINTGSSTATNSSNVWSGSGSSSVVNNASIETALNNGANVIITTNSSGAAGGNITVAANIAKTSGGNANLTLVANQTIALNSGVGITSTMNALGITMAAAQSGGEGAVSLTNNVFNTNGGNLSISGGSVNATSAGVTMSGVTFNLGAGTGTVTGTVMNGTGVNIYSTTVNGTLTVQGIASNGTGLYSAAGNGVVTLIQTGTGALTINGTSTSGTGILLGVNWGNSRFDTNGNVSFNGVSTSGSGLQFINNGNSYPSGFNAANGTTLNVTGTSTSGAGIYFGSRSGPTSTGAGNVTIQGNTQSGQGLYFGVFNDGQTLGVTGAGAMVLNGIATGNGTGVLFGDTGGGHSFTVNGNVAV